MIDLRRPGESGLEHPLAGADTTVVELPLFAEISLVALAQAMHDRELRDLYIETLAEAGGRIAETVGLIAERPGPVLVHCAVGKDRTGLVVAAALAAVGVPRAAIAADYHTTDANMRGALARIAFDYDESDVARAVADLKNNLPALLRAPPDGMDAVLDEFEAAGGAGDWLIARGLDPALLERLRERLVE